ncbi:hypothetical protein EMCRGX_G011722 [Ephydatia muelleri]
MVVACDLLHPIWIARRREKDCCASVPQHPYDSTARGMHTHPSSAHFESLALCFLASATRAEDHTSLASVKVIGLSSEVIVRSKAAGCQGEQVRQQDESAACQDQDHFQLRPDLLSKPYDRTPQKHHEGCSAHPATDLQARRDPPESQLQLPQSQLPQSQAQLLSSHSEDELRTVFLEESNPQSQLQTPLTTRPQPPFTPAANGLAPFQLSASQPSPYSGSQGQGTKQKAIKKALSS